MKFSIEKKERYTHFQLNEEKLDTLVAPELKSEFVTLGNEGVKSMILNLSETKYVDSSGLSSILVANRLCNNAGGKLVLCNVSDHVKKLFKISQLDSILTILPTVQESIDDIFLDELEKDILNSPDEEE